MIIIITVTYLRHHVLKALTHCQLIFYATFLSGSVYISVSHLCPLYDTALAATCISHTSGCFNTWP